MGSSVSGAINSYAGIEKYSPDFQLLGQVMNSKQTQLNSNRGKLQDYRNQLGALDVAKDEDRAYLDQRLDQVSDITNKYANLDLSSDALTNSLIGNMGQVFDQNVTAALTGTKILRNEQAEWTKMKEKDPSKYSDSNYAYAMRQANNWLNDGATGTRYNGGGGFIEYASPTEHINKMMPELLKAATHKRQRPIAGPAGGVGGIITEEYVDRNELQSMIQSQLGEKHLRQMQIDAWANYDQLPDNILEQDYNNFTEPKIQENEDKIKSLEAAIAIATNPDVKKQYQASLDYAKKEKDSFENENSFSSLMASRGKRDVYTTLHQAKLMDGFLDAYSREPLVVDIAVNAIDQANRTLEHQNEVLAETKSQNKITNQLKQDANEIAAYKAGINADGTPKDQATFYKGPEVKVTSVNEMPSAMDELLSKSNNIHNEIYNTLVNDMKVSPKLAKEFQKSKRYATMVQNGDIAGMTEIVLGEKQFKYKVSDSFRSKINELGSDVHNNPIIKDAYGQIDEMVNTAQKTMSKALANPGFGVMGKEAVPEFIFKLVPKKGTTDVYERVASDGSDYAKLLLKQGRLKKGEKLSAVEEANLQLYGNLHLLSDGGISQAQRRVVKLRVTDQLNTLNLSNKDFRQIDLTSKIGIGETIPNSKTRIARNTDSFMTEITKRNVETMDESDSNFFLIRDITRYQHELDKTNLDSIYRKKVEGLLEKAKIEYDKTGVDIEDLFLNGFKDIDNQISQATVRQTKLIAGNAIILPKSKNEGTWKALAARVGVSTTNTDDLVITPVIKEGKPTNYVTITTKASGKKQEDLEPVLLTTDELKSINVASFDLKDHKYNAVRGSAAPTLNLGKGNYKGKMDAGMNANQKSLLLKAIEEIPDIADEVKGYLSEYQAGKYTIKVVPMSGNYYTRILKEDGTDVIPGYEELVGPLIEDSQIDKYLANPKTTTDNAVYKMLATYVGLNIPTN